MDLFQKRHCCQSGPTKTLVYRSGPTPVDWCFCVKKRHGSVKKSPSKKKPPLNGALSRIHLPERTLTVPFGPCPKRNWSQSGQWAHDTKNRRGIYWDGKTDSLKKIYIMLPRRVSRSNKWIPVIICSQWSGSDILWNHRLSCPFYDRSTWNLPLVLASRGPVFRRNL